MAPCSPHPARWLRGTSGWGSPNPGWGPRASSPRLGDTPRPAPGMCRELFGVQGWDWGHHATQPAPREEETGWGAHAAPILRIPPHHADGTGKPSRTPQGRAAPAQPQGPGGNGGRAGAGTRGRGFARPCSWGKSRRGLSGAVPEPRHAVNSRGSSSSSKSSAGSQRRAFVSWKPDGARRSAGTARLAAGPSRERAPGGPGASLPSGRVAGGWRRCWGAPGSLHVAPGAVMGCPQGMACPKRMPRPKRIPYSQRGAMSQKDPVFPKGCLVPKGCHIPKGDAEGTVGLEVGHS